MPNSRDVKFGYFLVPDAEGPLLSLAQEAEQLGLDYIGIQDHPYQRRFVDTWVLLSMIAAKTSRIGLFPDVANLPLRPPAVLAKAAASINPQNSNWRCRCAPKNARGSASITATERKSSEDLASLEIARLFHSVFLV